MSNVRICVTVIHPLGTFTGDLETTDGPLTREDAETIVDELLMTVNSLESLGLKKYDGTKLSFNKQVLQQSILTFKVIDAEGLEETFR